MKGFVTPPILVVKGFVAILLGLVLFDLCSRNEDFGKEWSRFSVVRRNVKAARRAVLRPLNRSQLGFSAIKAQTLIIQEEARQTPSQHSATIAEVAPGEFLAAWFGGTWESYADVVIWGSRHKAGQGWSREPWVLAGQERAGEPCWNPVLVHLPASSETLLFYKVGMSPRTWRPLLRRSSDRGATWSAAEPISAPCMGPAKNKPFVLPDGLTMLSGASDEVDADMISMARESWQPKQNGLGSVFDSETLRSYLGPRRHLVEGWRSWVEVSTDRGYTWHRQKDIAFKGRVIQPALFWTKKWGFGMLLRPRSSGAIIRSSSMDGQHWTEGRATELPNPNSGIDAVALRDGRVLVVYNPARRFESGTGRHELAVAVSSDGGDTWKKAVILESRPEEVPVPSICCDSSKTSGSCPVNFRHAEYSYPSIIQASDGLVHVVYTYSYGAAKTPCSGRENIKHVVIDPDEL